MRLKYVIFFLMSLLAGVMFGQELPHVEPRMEVLQDGVWSEVEEYNGDAPLEARFEAQVEDLGDYTALYEWRFVRVGETSPLLKRFAAVTEYVFRESGAYDVKLLVNFVKAHSDTLRYEMDVPFRVSIAESRLEVPNAFSPNGDGINDVLKVKGGYQSIVKFRAMVFNRGGRKLYEWNDISQGWDGKYKGHDVPDGAYYLLLTAHGADGRVYRVKKTVSLLRGFDENESGVGQ